MYHHSNTDYAVAASEAAAKGRVKMQELINKGQQSALAVVEQVQSQVPVDVVAAAKAIKFDRSADNGLLLQAGEQMRTTVHKNALQQIASKTGMGMEFINLCKQQSGEWGIDLLAHNLNEFFGHSDERHLIRAVDGETRGVLSDKYRRLDSRPLLNAFVGACKEVGALPINGYALDTKVHLRAVLPMIFEPIDNEVMLFGLDWHNSDFGNGAHGVSLWNMRVWCTNTAIMEEMLRKVHLGGRLSDDVNYSAVTMELDTQANASALKDAVQHELAPARINKYLDVVRTADQHKITAQDAMKLLKSAKLPKGEITAITEAYNGADIEMLPAGNSVYRLTQAVSWIANTTEDAERSIELQQVAGTMLNKIAA